MVTLPAAPAAKEATGPQGAIVTYTQPQAASDIVDTSVPVTCAPASGTTFAVGTTKVTCSAKDTAGNEATAEFSVVVGESTGRASC